MFSDFTSIAFESDSFSAESVMVFLSSASTTVFQVMGFKVAHRVVLLGSNTKKPPVTAGIEHELAESTQSLPLLWVLLFRLDPKRSVPVTITSQAIKQLERGTQWLCQFHPNPAEVNRCAEVLINGLREGSAWKYVTLDFEDLNAISDGSIGKTFTAALRSLESPGKRAQNKLRSICDDDAWTKSASVSSLIGYSPHWFPTETKPRRSQRASKPTAITGWQLEKKSKFTRYLRHDDSDDWSSVTQSLEGVWVDFLEQVAASETLGWEHIFLVCEPKLGRLSFQVSQRPPFRDSFPTRQAVIEFCVDFDLIQTEYRELPKFQGHGKAHCDALRKLEKRMIAALKQSTSAARVRSAFGPVNKERKRTVHFLTKAKHHYSKVETLAIPAKKRSS